MGKGDATALQRDLESLASWSDRNHLPFNVSKCEQITITLKTTNEIRTVYSIKGTPLKTSTGIRDLGIPIDRKMPFIPHIVHTVKKARRNMGFIIRNLR